MNDMTCTYCGTKWDRPEDYANHVYYSHEMKAVRRRIMIEVDVEYRDDDPEYSRRALEADVGLISSRRVRNPRVVPFWD